MLQWKIRYIIFPSVISIITFHLLICEKWQQDRQVSFSKSLSRLDIISRKHENRTYLPSTVALSPSGFHPFSALSSTFAHANMDRSWKKRRREGGGKAIDCDHTARQFTRKFNLARSDISAAEVLFILCTTLRKYSRGQRKIEQAISRCLLALPVPGIVVSYVMYVTINLSFFFFFFSPLKVFGTADRMINFPRENTNLQGRI